MYILIFNSAKIVFKLFAQSVLIIIILRCGINVFCPAINDDFSLCLGDNFRYYKFYKISADVYSSTNI